MNELDLVHAQIISLQKNKTSAICLISRGLLSD